MLIAIAVFSLMAIGAIVLVDWIERRYGFWRMTAIMATVIVAELIAGGAIRLAQ